MLPRKPSLARVARGVACGLAALWVASFVYLRAPVLADGAALAPGPIVDSAALRRHVHTLSTQHPARSVDSPPSLFVTEAYLRAELHAMGYEVDAQEVRAEGRGWHNLVVRHGPRDAREIVVVGAHFDVCGDDNPGADDNATGVAVLLEVARLLKTLNPPTDVPIELVAYTLEEPPYFATPLMGSAEHARKIADRGGSVRLMLSLEMLGYYSNERFSQRYPIPLLYAVYPSTGDFVALVGRPTDRAATRVAKSAMLANMSVDVVSISAPPFVPGIDFSDHRSYWARGWPALMVTDTAFLRNTAYHEAGDTEERLDFAKLAEVTKGIYAAVVAAAQGAPVAGETGRP